VEFIIGLVALVVIVAVLGSIAKDAPGAWKRSGR
jgi:hypothetical protein